MTKFLVVKRQNHQISKNSKIAKIFELGGPKDRGTRGIQKRRVSEGFRDGRQLKMNEEIEKREAWKISKL